MSTVPIAENFDDPQGRYIYYDTTPGMTDELYGRRHTDVRSFNFETTTQELLMLSLNYPMQEMNTFDMQALETSGSVSTFETWTDNVDIGPDPALGNRPTLRFTCAVGTNVAQSATNPVDLRPYQNIDGATLSASLPDFPAGDIDLDNSSITVAQDTESVVLPLTGLSAGDVEASWPISDLGDVLEIDSVILTIEATAPCVVAVAALRALGPAWSPTALDIDTITNRLRPTVNQDGTIPSTSFPKIWRSGMGEIDDPQPINSRLGVVFNGGSLAQANRITLYMRGRREDYITQLDLDGAGGLDPDGSMVIGDNQLTLDARGHQPNFGAAVYNPRPQSDLNTLTQRQLAQDPLGYETVVATNVVTNPSFEVDTTGHTATRGTITRTTTDGAVAGTAAGRLVADGTGNALDRIRIEVTAGQSGHYALSAKGAARTLSLQIDWYTAADAWISTTTAANAPTMTGEFQRVTSPFTAPANTAYGLFGPTFISPAANEAFIFDALQVEVGDTLHDYFDGDSQYGRWTGTAHNSSSEYVSDRTQAELERVVDTISEAWIEANINFGTTNSIQVRTTESSGATFSLPALTANQKYFAAIDIEDSRIRVTLYELLSLGAIEPSTPIFATGWLDNDFIFKRRKGRLGWQFDLADGDAYIESIRPRGLMFGEIITNNFESITPIEGAQIFVGGTPNRQLSIHTGIYGDATLEADLHNARSEDGSVKVTAPPLSGIQTGYALFEDFANTEILFDLWYPAAALNNGEYLDAELVNTEGYAVPLVLTNISGDKWQTMRVRPLQAVNEQTGMYSFRLGQQGSERTWWIDNLYVEYRSVSWSGRATTHDPWGRNDDWMGFRHLVNSDTDGAMFPQRGRRCQIRGQTLVQNAHIDKVYIKPRYAHLGRLVWQ